MAANYHKKGTPVHIAPACAVSGKGSNHFGSYVRSLSLHPCKRLFLGLESMVTRQQLYRCARASLPANYHSMSEY
jgi:hypothetical protein